MARSFNGSNQYATLSTLPIIGFPFSMGLWFNTSNTSSLMRPMQIAKLGSGGVYMFAINLRGDLSTKYVDAQENPGSLAQTTSAYSANTWHHALAVFNSQTDRRIYLDGGAKGTNSTSGGAMSSVTGLILGAGTDGSGGFTSYFSGRVAEAGIWNAALTDADAASLARGCTPIQVCPSKLAAYYPLGGHYGQLDVDRWKNRYDLTAYNSPTWADHPRVIYPRRSFWFPSPLPAAPTSYTLEALPASVDVVGKSAALSAVRRITAQPATIEVVGQEATLRVIRKIVASPATVDVVGQSATLTRARTLTANAAEVQVSGQAAGLTATRKITASPAAIEVVGQAANLRVVRRIVASPATVEVVGQTAVTRRTALLQGLAATIAVVGQVATLTYSGEAAVIPEDWIGIDKAIGRTPQATATHRVGTATAVGRVSKSTAYQRPV